MSEFKTCSQCHVAKELPISFYICAGKFRSECKACTVKKNVQYNKNVRAWRQRYVSDEARKLYMRQYYDKNRAKFAVYRSKFKSRYPNYYREYFRKHKYVKKPKT